MKYGLGAEGVDAPDVVMLGEERRKVVVEGVVNDARRLRLSTWDGRLRREEALL